MPEQPRSNTDQVGQRPDGTAPTCVPVGAQDLAERLAEFEQWVQLTKKLVAQIVIPAPAGPSTSVSLPPTRSVASTRDSRATLFDAAVDWAAAQSAVTGATTGWRSIIGATDDRTGARLFAELTEYAAKKAARVAKERL